MSSTPRRRRMGGMRRRQLRTAYLFLSPAILYFALFMFWPLYEEFLLSFTRGFTTLRPVGWENYTSLLYDPDVRNAFTITVIYATFSLVIGAALGLILALILNQNFRGRTLARTMILTPYMTSIAIVGLMWRNILDPTTGILNSLLSTMGLPTQQWLSTAPLATLVGITVWQESGYFMLLFLAGLQGLDPQVYEAARIDGLSEYGIYWRIMLPLSTAPIASLAIITFTRTWNDYMGPLIYLRRPDIWTIQLGLQSFVGQYNADYAAIMTGSVISVLPIAIVFVIGQRYFVQGIATSGMKN